MVVRINKIDHQFKIDFMISKGQLHQPILSTYLVKYHLN